MSKHVKERKQKASGGFVVPKDFTSYLAELDAGEASNPFEAMIDILLGRS
jgi:hypothetical protein